MLLAVLITAGSIGLLVAVGWLADNLLGGHADRWAKTLVNKSDADEPERRR
ncbi:hypothetical protein [Kribbella soli]|uniref:hypothetical protein n=1 Tax=Kribbella soli TaxID=1124743 RepID=UPI0013F4B400|nr:hypothetical protein [Kribbella soli]